VDVFGTCEDALKVLESNIMPDCIITDVALGAGMDGWYFARKARQGLPEFPVIVMRGFMDNKVVQSDNALDLPILRKPFREAELSSLIERASIESASGS